MLDLGTILTVSVVGCQMREPKGPVFHGESTCNIEEVSVYDMDLLEFHPNHTGTIVPAEFMPPLRPDLPGLSGV
jgi:hypothetical protein